MTANGIEKSTALVTRQEFGGSAIQTQAETAALAVAAQAKASVEARWIVAMRAPRDMDQVRAELLKECQRPSFAAVARYRKPIGQGIEGLSIRFVEAALQAMTNILTDTQVVYDDDDKRILSVTVTDLERNVTHPKQITVSKTVERKNLRKGQAALGKRTNSYGDTIYIVRASDDDLLNKEAALVSKALRTCGLRLIPGWLQDECEQQIRATVHNQVKADPDAERRKLADAFSAIGVEPADLAKYLGHDLGKVVPGELVELRAIYTTIRAGEATWADTLATKLEQRGEDAPPPAAAEPSKGVAATKDKLAKPKRPSTSKAAKAARTEELKALTVTDPKAAQQYVAYGDPKNKAKAIEPLPDPEPTPEPETNDEEAAELERLEAQAAEEIAAEEKEEGPPPISDDDDVPDWAK